MARFFVTGFTGGSGGAFGVVGQVLDNAAGVNQYISVDNIVIDPASSQSARQQIQDLLVVALNAQLVSSSIPLTMIASDIEYVC